MKGNSTTNKITEGAVIVALTVVLNFFKLDLGPEGGSVNLVFIPLMVFALRRGTFWGIGAGLVFGVLKAIIGGGISYGWQSLLLDYAVAYALVGLAGLLPSKPVLSTVFGAAGCLASFVLSGVLIWGHDDDLVDLSHISDAEGGEYGTDGEKDGKNASDNFHTETCPGNPGAGFFV